MIADGERRVSCLSDQHDAEAADMSESSLAERVGMEPTVPLPGQQFSRLPRAGVQMPSKNAEIVLWD